MARGYRLMGIVNVTPDSFSDGGRFLDASLAIAHGRLLAADGADVLDVGGESTRPGAHPVAEDEELRRVIPVVEGLRGEAGGTQISIDTSTAAVARAALSAGASLVNDVTALRGDGEMAGVVAGSGAECCLMHMRGEPRTMQQAPRYEDVVDEVRAFLEERMGFAVGEGVAEERILLDPGIGFGKSELHNLELIRRLGELASLGRPIVFGSSRKTFLGRVIARARGLEDAVSTEERTAGTVASNVMAFERGASVFRVHEVAPLRDALAVAAATLGSRWTPGTTARI